MSENEIEEQPVTETQPLEENPARGEVTEPEVPPASDTPTGEEKRDTDPSFM